MKLKGNIAKTGTNNEDNFLTQSSMKTKGKLLELIESGDMDAAIKKLSKKQDKSFKIYEEEGLSDDLLQKISKWAEKVNLYLDHGGKVYLLETAGGDFYYRCIIGLSMDKKGVILQSVAPYQYEYKKIKDRNSDSIDSKKNIECIFALDIGKKSHSISH